MVWSVAAAPVRRAILSVAVAFALPALGLASAPSRAAVLTADDILKQFNAVVADTFKTGHDVEGRLVAGTISNNGSSTFYNNPTGAPSSFQAINAQTIQGCSSCNVNNGGSVNYINSNSGSFNFNGGGSAAQNNPAFAISDFTTPLDALQTQLGNLASNSTVSLINTNELYFDVDPNAQGVAIFDISVADLSNSNISSIQFSSESANTIIINVTGASFTEASGTNFNGDTYLAEHVIWNFEDATSVSLKQWYGAVLAGGASVTNSSPINGFLYANDFTGGGELHSFAFDGRLPSSAPEPSTWAMMALGFAGLGFVALRRGRAARPAV